MTAATIVRAGQVLAGGPDEAIRAAVPDWLVPVFVAISLLGNVVFLLGLFTLDYWFGDHHRGAHALSLALAGMAVVTTLKALFAEPRPPEAVRLVGASGFSFPSGHAAIATIGYGALAHDLKLGTRRARVAVAVVLVALIALSRVVLGVHFLRDVVAGIAVGVVFLAGMAILTGHDPRQGFLAAAVLGVVALLASGGSQDSVVEFGAILGAVVTWEAVDTLPPVDSHGGRLVLFAGGLPVFVGGAFLSLFVDLPLVAVFLVDAALLAGVVAAPIPAHLVGRHVASG